MTGEHVDEFDAPLAAILAEYITRLDRGEAVSREEVMASHPSRAAELRTYFADADLVARLAGNGLHEPPLELASPVRGPGEFGDYELLEEIGRGGMGIVYKVRERTTGRLLALKMLLAGLFAAPRDIERFRNEARAAANLKHPAIVPIYHVGEHQGHLFYTMPWIEGTNLARRLAEAPFDAHAAAELMATVAEAVDDAHTCGVIHRDLKPANILLDTNGKPYVADFGVAHRPGDPKAVWSTPGDVVGTLRYMSPEQAEGEIESLDGRTDVYSLGVTLYELLARVPAFPEKDQARLLDDIRHKRPVALTELSSSVPPELEAIVIKALAKDAHERYASAADLVADLRRFLRPQSDVTREKLGFAQRGNRFDRYRRTALTTIGVATVLLCAGAFWLWRARGSNDAELSPAQTALSPQESVFELPHPNRAQGNFGNALAVADDRIAVAAPGSRTVYLFDNGGRRLIHSFCQPTIAGFGVSVALSGEMLAVGAHVQDAGSGMAFLYDLRNGQVLHELHNPSPAPQGDLFGARVAILKDKVLVTALTDSEESEHAGAVYVFDVATGRLVRRIASPTPSPFEELFGYALAVLGKRVFIGAPRIGSLGRSGSVHLFDVENGELVRTLGSPASHLGIDQFGATLAVVGDRWLLVGAPASSAVDPVAGAAYLFDVQSGELLQTYASPNPTPHGHFGMSLQPWTRTTC